MNRASSKLFALATLLWLSLGCDREERRFHESAALNKPAMGSAMNPDVAAGVSSVPPVDVEPPSPLDPYSENAFMVSQGKQLYVTMNCVGCHAMGGGGMGPPLMDDEWLYGIDPTNIYLSVVEGRPNGMPSYRGKLTYQQVWQLVAYVRSMSGQLRKDVSPSRSDHMQVRPAEQSTAKENPHKQEEGANQKESPR